MSTSLLLSLVLRAVTLSALVSLTVIAASVITRHWKPSATSRGSNWTIEALLFTIGPLHQLAEFGYVNNIASLDILNRPARAIELILLGFVAVGSFRSPRAGSRPAVALLGLYFSALVLSGLFGAAINIPYTYLLFGSMLTMFVANGTTTPAALTFAARFSLRAFLVLNMLALAAMPTLALFVEGTRSFFGIPQFRGITGHPNSLAFLALIGLLVEICTRGRLLFVLLYGASIVFAQSSTAYLLTIACTAAIILVRVSRRPVATGIPFALAVVPFVLVNFDFLTSWLPSNAHTLTGRTTIWAAALQGFREYPVFGYGPALLDEDYRAQWLGKFDAAAQAHNQFVQDLGGAGMIGVSALTILTIYLIVRAIRGASESTGLTLALAVAFLGRMMVETPLRPTWSGSSIFLAAVIFGIIFGYPATNDELNTRASNDWAVRGYD